MIMDTSGVDEEELQGSLAPFLESYGLAETEAAAAALCSKLCTALKALGMQGAKAGDDNVKLLDKVNKLSASLLTKEEQYTID